MECLPAGLTTGVDGITTGNDGRERGTGSVLADGYD